MSSFVSSFSFEWPWVLILLPLGLVWLGWVIFSKKLAQTSQLSTHHNTLKLPLRAQLGALLDLHTTQTSPKSKPSMALTWLWRFLLVAFWFLLIVSAARPISYQEKTLLPQQSRDIFLALDLSESMLQQDYQYAPTVVTRLAAMKFVVSQFIEQRQGDRIGLVFFADRAYTQSPLTRDLATIQNFLNEAQVGLVGVKTAIGDAIALVSQKVSESLDLNQVNNPIDLNQESLSLNNETSFRPVLVLLSDGENNAGVFSPNEAADLAAEFGIKVYTIAMLPSRVSFFTQGRVQAHKQVLQQIAQKTQGRFFEADSTEKLSLIYETINNLEAKSQTSVSFKSQKSLFITPLLLAFIVGVVLCLLFLISRHRFNPD